MPKSSKNKKAKAGVDKVAKSSPKGATVSAPREIDFEALAERIARRVQQQTFRPDRLLVTIEREVRIGARAGVAAATLAESVDTPLLALEREGLIEDVTAIGVSTQRSSYLTAFTASVEDRVDDAAAGVNLVRLAPGARLEEVQRRLDDVVGITDVERVPYRRIIPSIRRRTQAATKQWYLGAIGHTAGPDAAGVKVAVLDTGVDENHPAIRVGRYETDYASAEDVVGHGTHVAAILAGASVPNQFLGGVSSADVWMWKIFEDNPDPSDGEYYVDEVLYLRALVAAQRAGCRVMNLSIGASGSSRSEQRLIDRLTEGGMVVVAAMGNEYLEGNPTSYPAAYRNVIAVGAVDQQLRRAAFSNTGNHIALVAPGDDIFSALPRTPSPARQETNYAAWPGTSMATPMVAAAAARLLAVDASLSAGEVRERLTSAAKKLPSMGGRTFTRGYGHGLLQL